MSAAGEADPSTPAVASEDGCVTITAVNLSGDLIWGPESVPSRESVEALHRRIARGLKKQSHRVQLVKDSEVLRGDSSLAATGFAAEVQLQVVAQDFTEKIQQMQASMGVEILPGLTDEEVEKAEAKFGFTFPPELREFLQVGLPTKWHNWRELIKDSVMVGFEADTVSQQLLWNATPEEEEDVPDEIWELVGSRDLEEVKKQASLHRLVPIAGHRMMPSVPHEFGLPVLSMHQCSDNIIYGMNFWQWLVADAKVNKDTIPEELLKEQKFPNFEEAQIGLPFWGRYLG